MAAMPHLVKMDRKYAKKGFQLIGAHGGEATEDQLKDIIKNFKIEFPIATRVNSPVPASRIPHLIVFDASGKLVFSGRPSDSDAEKAIGDALKKIDAPADAANDESPSELLPRNSEPLVDLRSWTNAEGKTMKAKLLSVENGTGKFAFADGRIFDYALDKLSEDDQKVITEKTAAPASE